MLVLFWRLRPRLAERARLGGASERGSAASVNVGSAVVLNVGWRLEDPGFSAFGVSRLSPAPM